MTTAGDRQLIVTVPERAARRAGPAGRPDRRAALPGRVRRRAGDTAAAPEPTPRPARQPSEPTAEPRPRRADADRVGQRWPRSRAAIRQQQAVPGAADGSTAAAGRGVPVRRRPGHPAGPGDRVAAERDLPGRVRRVHLRRTGRTTSPTSRCSPATETGTEKYLLGPTLIEGDQLTTASAGIPQNDVSWVVDLEFNAEGAAPFEEATRALSAKGEPQNRFAIVLDGVVISAPSVEHADPRRPGRRSRATSTRRPRPSWPTCLKYGALPLAFEVSEVNNVSATLGGEQLRAGIIAGIIGLALVVAVLLRLLPRAGHRGRRLAGGRRGDHLRLHGAARQLGRLRAQPARHRRGDRRHRHHRRQLRHLLRADPRRGARGPQPADRGGDRLAAGPADHPDRRRGVDAVGGRSCSSWPSARSRASPSPSA